MKNKGITLIGLTITIIILIIIAGISVNAGTNIIKKAKLEELKTNMLLIQAKAKEYVEEANFKIGKDPDESKIQQVRDQIYIEKAHLEYVNETNVSFDTTDCYELNEQTYKDWGLNEIKLDENEKYLLKFDENNLAVQVYNTKGYNGKYSLTEIEDIKE